MSRSVCRPLAVAVLGFAALLSGLALVSCGGGNDETTTAETTAATDTTTSPSRTETTTTAPPALPTTIRVTVTGGVPEGGIVRESVNEGDRVVLLVRSDVADEVHLHGYDLSTEVPAGGTRQIAFRATVPGRFEVELEHRGIEIAEISVEP